MNKSAIQKFAIWARKELIAQVSQKAYQYGITEKGYGEADAVTVGGRALTSDEAKQRRELVAQIRQKGYTQVMEEVAYTWFNRFIALRFMEVNNYLPSHIRVFSDSTGAFKPEILSDALHLDLPGLDKDKVAAYIESNQTEDLYRYLLLTQCNALNEALPRMFEKMGGYTELLFPNNILKADSVLGRMVTDIPEEDWTDQVQIIGWLYQYYIAEKHDQIVNIYKGTVKKEDIPAATQLFTTDWVVRYMVDNSLGRYWIERHPESKLRDKLEFYVLPKSGEITYIDDPVKPQDLTFFDPCMGSGHILVYAFDVLMEIYKENGYGERDAAAEIVRNNIFGLDIDERCSQLAYFAVMMKARSYDRRFLTRGIKPHVLSIRESNPIETFTHSKFMPDASQNEIGEYLVDLFRDAKEIGSLKIAKSADYDAFQNYLEDCSEKAFVDIEFSLWNTADYPLMEQLAEQAKVLSKKYTVVCTNPPYLGKLEGKLKTFVTEEFKPYSGDLFSVFIYHNFAFCKKDGYSGFMTPFVWMFIKTYENLREFIINNKSITTLIQMEYSAFEEATVPICSFVLQNKKANKPGLYFRLSDFKGGMEIQKEKVLEAIAHPNYGYFYEANQSYFSKIPGSPVAYWASDRIFDSFCRSKVNSIAFSDGQILTGDNEKYLRMLWEVEANEIRKDGKWMLHAKGGEFRKWAGNLEWVVKWSHDAIEHYKHDKIARFPKEHILFRRGVTWSLVSTNPTFGARLLPESQTFNKAAATILFDDEKYVLYVLALLNSSVINYLSKIINPTLNNNIKDILAMPFIYDTEKAPMILKLTNENIESSEVDWNAAETSWEFNRHPLVRLKLAGAYAWGDKPPVMRLTSIYNAWKLECEGRFEKLKANEEELNRIFIDIYGLQDELTPEIADKDITVHRIFDTKDDVPESMKGSNYVRTKRDEIVSLISYAVGCMFGRYSLDVEGLAYAGGEWDASKYSTIIPDKDNIIPICDDDYFDDDITGRFVKWVETVYGSDTLEENLKFIADALEGKGTPRDVIRSYFLNGFYADHCKTYQKRPIYWLFDSGKKNGFKALIYMHRYQSDLLARMRTDYVHEQQERYRTQLAHLADALERASGSERVKLTKQQKKLQDQSLEIQKYEEKIHHLADQNISIDLDDGVKHNYALFADVLAKIK